MDERSVNPPPEEGGGQDFKSYEITCLSCKHKFLFSSGEQRFYHLKGLVNRPKRCRSCRFARKADKASISDRPSAPTPAPLSRPPSSERVTYSLPIVTHPGLVLESDSKGFIAAVDPGRVLRVGSGKRIAPGTYVTFTRTTTKGDFLLHEVLGNSPPEADIRLKASILTVAEDQVTLRVHFNNAVLACTAPDFDVSQGMRVLFSAGWSADGLQADRVTGPDDSNKSHSQSAKSAWKYPFDPLSGSSAPSFEYDIIHPSASASLARALRFTHDLNCHPKLSPAPFAFAEDSRRGAVPKLSLLRMEELASPGSWSGGRPGDSEGESKAPDGELTTYVLIGTRSTGHLLTQYLRRCLSEIDSLGLERRVIVLYPIEEGTTAHNFYGVTSSKLFQSKLLPVTKVEVLTEPVLMATARTCPVELSGRVTARRMVAVHYEVSSRRSIPSIPPVSELTVSSVPPDPPGGNLDLPGVSCLTNAVRFSVPKGVLDPVALRKALPRGTLLHSVGHAMAASYTTYEAVFATERQATKFVDIISVTNRSLKDTEHWLAAPLSDYWGGDKVFTIFTSKNFQKDKFYKLFEANWAFAVNHTQVRFNTDLSLTEICKIVDKCNSSSRGLPFFFRLSGDERGVIEFNRKGGTIPRFPPGGTEPSIPMASGMADSSDDEEILTFLHNVPMTSTLNSVQTLVSTLEPKASNIFVLQQRGALCVQFAVPDATTRAGLLERPCRKMGGHYLYLSASGPDPTDTTASHECSGAGSMESLLREAMGACHENKEADSSRSDAKESVPSSSSSPATTGTAPVASSSTPEGMSASGSSVEPMRSLPSGLPDQLARHLPSDVTDRPDLINIYLDDYSAEALSVVISDPTSLSSLARDLTGFVRDELAGEDSEEDEESLIQSGQGSGDRGWSEGSCIPDTQDTMVCDYNFSAAMKGRTTPQRDCSPSNERSSKKAKKQ